MYRNILAALFGLTIIGWASTANATILSYNFEVFSPSQPGTIEGMFSGDTGDDEVLSLFGSGDIVSSFMVTFTDTSGSFTDFSLDIPTNHLDEFAFDPATDSLEFAISVALFADPRVAYFSDFGALLLDDGQVAPFSAEGATHSATVKVPEPATMGLFAIGLAGIGVMSRRRRKQRENA